MTNIEVGRLVSETLGYQTPEGEDPYLDPPSGLVDWEEVGEAGF